MHTHVIYKKKVGLTVLDHSCPRDMLTVADCALKSMKENSIFRKAEATRLLFLGLKKNYSLRILQCLFSYNVDPNATMVKT